MSIKYRIREEINENPDNITNYTGMFRYGDELNWEDKNAFGFGYVDGEMIITGKGEAHDDIKDDKGKLYRRDYTFAGRIWTYDKIISFWEYPPPNLIFKIIRDLRKKLHININDTYKIETLPNAAKPVKDKQFRGPLDWKSQYQGDVEKPVFLTPTEYSKLGGVSQPSPAELAKQHVVSPMLKDKSSGVKKTPIPIQQKYSQQIGDGHINLKYLIKEEINKYIAVKRLIREWEDPNADWIYDLENGW